MVHQRVLSACFIVPYRHIIEDWSDRFWFIKVVVGFAKMTGNGLEGEDEDECWMCKWRNKEYLFNVQSGCAVCFVLNQQNHQRGFCVCVLCTLETDP